MASQSPLGHLVSSEHVEGTNVYSTNGNDHIGDIHHLMIDKSTGRVVYAVMSFGGVLGLGKSYYPIPWNALKYDTNLDGFVTGITAAQLKDAPTEPSNWEDRDWETRLHQHYGTPSYWETAPHI